jgi:signal transduction histidine kinase/CheY-like chemotaxis protein
MRLPLATIGLLAVLTAVYFAASKLGLSFATINTSASAVWPPTGIALAAFLLFGKRVWPAIFAGAFAANLTTAGNLFTSLGIAAGNTLEGIVGAMLVDHFAGGRNCFEHARDVFRFAGLAAFSSTAISATVGVIVLSLGGFAPWPAFGSVWLTWWLGDAVGALVVTPLVILWASGPGAAFPRERFDEAWLALFAVAAAAFTCFVVPGFRDYPLAFLCLAPLAWIAVRIGSREVATGIIVVATIAVAATERGMGPFVMASRNESLVVLQAFMGMVALTLLPMAALVREHRQAVSEAEAATRARDVFLAMLSHELRNPLQAITNSLHLLHLRSLGPEDIGRAVGIARRQSDHLSRLLNDLLDMTRAVSGNMSLEMRLMRLDEAVRRSVDLLAGMGKLEKRDVVVETEAVLVNADPLRLEQIVSNLITNAAKFTEPGGTIRILVRDENGKPALHVQDDGAGIPADLLPRVFDLFTQGERRLEKSQGGLGLGLTLVRTFTELHGGRVQARSAGAGQGSEFVIRFPRAETAARSADRPTIAPAVPAQRILIIEDNADARESLHAVLSLDGHEVHEAADGEEGIAMAERVKPDFVLVDIGLPRIDGYEVARRLRAAQETLGVHWRLIAVSGYGQPEDVQRAKDAGFDTHLVKPVFPVALQQAMAN